MVLELCEGRVACCDKTDVRFAEESTCHGLSRFCNSWHIGRRIFWFVLVMVSVGMLIVQLEERFQNFLKFDLKTEKSLDAEPMLALPSVTICNMNMFTKSLLTPMDYELLKVSNMVSDWIQVTYSPDNWGSNITDKYWDKVKQYELMEDEVLARYNVTSFDMEQWLYRTGWQLNSTDPQTLIQCTVGRMKCTVEDFVPTLTPQGLCYTLKSSERYYQKLPGLDAGLNILLDIDQNDYTAYKLDSRRQYECGAKVLLHEPYDQVYSGTNLARYVGIDPGKMGFLSITKDLQVKENIWPWSVCESDIEISKRNCLAKCTARDTIQKCDCRLWFESSDGPLCSVARSTACLIYKETVKNFTVDEQCHATCSHACNETYYSVGVSYTLLTSSNTVGEFLGMLNTMVNDSENRYNMIYIKQNLLSLQIAYPDLMVNVAHSTPAFPLSAFISDLGGQLGLFAGISVITIFELLEYPFVKLYSIYTKNRKLQKGKRNSRQSSDSIAPTNTTTASSNSSSSSSKVTVSNGVNKEPPTNGRLTPSKKPTLIIQPQKSTSYKTSPSFSPFFVSSKKSSPIEPPQSLSSPPTSPPRLAYFF